MTRPDDTNLPVWLRGVPLPEPPPSAMPAAPQEESAGLPSWLRDLSGAESPGSAVSSLPAEVPFQPDDQPAEDEGDLPDWLQSLGETVSSPAPSASAPAAPEPPIHIPRAPGFTNWLTGEPSPPPAQTSAQKEDLPAWLRGAAADQPAGSEELPDWLQSLDPKPPTSPADPTVAAPPSWQASQPAAPAPAEDTTPAWLRDVAPVAESGSSAQPSHAAEADQGVPDWLRATSEADQGKISGDDSDFGMAPFSLDDAPASGSASEWLGANASQLIGGPATPEARADAESNDLDDLGSDIPSWLRDAAGPIPDDEPQAPAWADQPGSPSALPTGPADEADDVPAWLRDVTPSAPAPADDAPAWLSSSASASPAEPPAAEDVPAWLREVAPAATPSPAEDVPAWLSGGAPPAPAELPSAEDVPAWLSSGTAAAAATPSPTEDVPAWLREGTVEPAITPAADQHVPDWLRSGQIDAPATISGTPGAVDNDLPAWMRDSSTPAAPEHPAADVAGDLPDWLRNTPDLAQSSASDALPPWLHDEVGEPLPTSIAPGDAGLPAWLRGSDLEFSGPATPAAPQPTEVPTSREATQSTATSDSDLLGGADLPAWLRRDTEKPREANPSDARSLDWLAQLGTVDDDIVPAAAEAGPRLHLPAPPTRTVAQVEALALLRSMAADPFPVAAPPEAAAPPSALRRIGLDRFLSIVLLLALLAGLATPGLASGLTPPPATPAVRAFHDQISTLGQNDVVLIGYEWDAQRISELRPLERAVIGQLIAQNVRVVLVSTDPQGSLLQFDLRDQLTAAGYQGGGLDYVLLGYRAGGEIGLRQLAQDFRGALRSDFQGKDATNGALATNLATSEPRINTLNDFAMILVLADEPTDVQGWMEQIRPATTRPLSFLVPASVGPFAQPYFRLPGVHSLVGTPDALAYEQLRGGDASSATALQASQLRLTSLIFAGLLAISTVGVLIGEVVLRRRRNA